MKMKTVVWVGGLIVLAALLSAWAQDPSSAQEPRLVTVMGNAQVRVVPDEAILVLGVETWDEELQVAKGQNDARVKAILALAAEYDVPPQHVKTDYLNVQPGERDYQERQGYWVRKTVVLTLRDLTRFEELLAAALEAGVTHVHEVQFRTTELRAHKDRARALAIQAAQEKARALAGELGQSVGQPFDIRENHSGWWYGSSAWWGSRWGNNMAQNVVQEVDGAAVLAGDSVAPGQITVDAQVTVSFTLRP